jgi:alpha-tubulin suppressor-like RCC1 family protein
MLGRGDGVFLAKSNKPLTVSRIPRGATTVSVGDSHACAIVQGVLACWGSNGNGELGLGSTAPSSVPQKVSLPGPASAVSAGRSFTCAIANGGVYCWGMNAYFTLAEEGDQQVTVPRAVPELASGIGLVAASQEHGCAANAYTVLCWGTNQGSCLGSTVQMTGTPQTVGNGATKGAAALALGNMHSCSLDGGGQVLCWGDNLFGELGLDSVQISTATPVVPTGMGSGVTSICAGFDFTCAVVNGGVMCMGDNSKGQLGDGSGVQNRRVAVAAQGLTSGAKEVACGFFHACALLDSGAMKCWGDNSEGQLGTSNDNASATPAAVTWP